MNHPKAIHDVWDSFEWLFKSDLRKLDHRARQMFSEMQATHTANANEIREFMQESFAMLWEQVAAEQEKLKRRTGT